MIIEVKKTLNVDFGAFGTKRLELDMRFEQTKKEGWQLYCLYAYVVDSSGSRKTPVQKEVLTHQFIQEQAAQALQDIKGIDRFGVEVMLK